MDIFWIYIKMLNSFQLFITSITIYEPDIPATKKEKHTFSL